MGRSRLPGLAGKWFPYFHYARPSFSAGRRGTAPPAANRRMVMSATVCSVEAFPVRYPTKGRFKFLEGPESAPRGRPAVLVKITTAEGVVGWGESVPLPLWSYETLESAAAAITGYLGPALMGHDPFDLTGAHAAMDAVIAGSFTRGMPLAKAGIDLALHDLGGKLTGQSLAQRWGCPDGGEVELSWTVNPSRLSEAESLVQEGRDKGYRHFNVKVGRDPQFDRELCRIVDRMAPGSFLWADANGGYDLHSAKQVVRGFADIGVDVLEQPLPAHQLAGYRELKRLGAIPILMDEGVVTPTDLVEFIRLDMLDGLALKPARTGGVFASRRQLEILQDAGLLVLGSGLTDPDVSLAASLALYAAYRLRFPAALNGPQFLAASVLTEPLTPRAGKLTAPLGAGLGIEVDEGKIERLAAPAVGAWEKADAAGP